MVKTNEYLYDKIAHYNKKSYYNRQIFKLYKFIIPKSIKVIELGCGNGNLLSELSPSKGVGISASSKIIEIARKKYPKLKFFKSDLNNIKPKEVFDYIILSDLIGNLDDVQKTLQEVRKISDNNSRIVINYINYFWHPFILLIQKLQLKTPQPIQNWLSSEDVKNLLDLTDFEIIKESKYLLLPVEIPAISDFVNKYIARLPLIRNLCFVNYLVVKKKPEINNDHDYAVSIIIPARNESGNIETAVREIPSLGRKTEIIFVEGHSKDDTKKEIERVINKYKNERNIILVNQGKGNGKADAVRKGIAKSNGEIIIIFDADLTVSPTDLPKFYQAIKEGKAEFIQGSRLLYPMEKEAMRTLNVLGNKFFGSAFSFLLDQRIKDTLCGTKAIFRKKYDEIARNRSYFGEFDPFGDFDLIYGSSKLNLKIMEIPIRYKARVYGSTNISRFKHGWLLLKMTLIAARKIKFF